MTAGNGEAADPKTLDAIMAETWDETYGEDATEIPVGHEHLGAPNDKEDNVDTQDDSSSTPQDTEDEPEVPSGDPEIQDDTPPEEPVEEPASASEEDSETPQERSEAPEHWSQEDRKMFDELDEGAQEFLLRRHKQMEGDYTRKTQENAEAIKVGKLLDEGMDPAVRADLRRIGVDNESYLQQMMQWHHMSLTDPAAFARNVVQQLRLDPAQVFGLKPGEAPQPADPTTQRIEAVENRLNAEQVDRQNKAIEETQAAVNAFKDEKDDAGNLLRPHFEQVRKVMAQFVTIDPNMTMQDAYEAAVFKDPELRATFVAPNPAPSANGENRTERTKKALRAKKANIKSGANGSVNQPQDDKPMSLQDAMNSAADSVGF